MPCRPFISPYIPFFFAVFQLSIFNVSTYTFRATLAAIIYLQGTTGRCLFNISEVSVTLRCKRVIFHFLCRIRDTHSFAAHDDKTVIYVLKWIYLCFWNMTATFSRQGFSLAKPFAVTTFPPPHVNLDGVNGLEYMKTSDEPEQRRDFYKTDWPLY